MTLRQPQQNSREAGGNKGACFRAAKRSFLSLRPLKSATSKRAIKQSHEPVWVQQRQTVSAMTKMRSIFLLLKRVGMTVTSYQNNS
jgi:hypothetical protein